MKVDFLSAILQKDVAEMYPLCMIVLSSDQGMVLLQEDRALGGHVALLRRKTTIFNGRLLSCIPLTLIHCRLRRPWCQATAHWRAERRSVVFSNESSFCLSASDGRVLVKTRPEARLQPNCRRVRHIGPTPEVMSGNSQPIVLPFMNSIQGWVFQYDSACYYTVVLMQRILQSFDVFPWPTRSPNLSSPIEHVWDIIG
ncbi:transposable element Tc1 transposase [Trichonephila clavipes]|nr:transposable element Tc1 transposase [Trichonephila clavipes]